jgi:1-acyl-sn-glycerol-3-phosphate acyltransferase
MFPEGYPRIDPWPTPGGPMADPLPLRRGFADLAWRAQHLDGVTVPIVPVSIAYAADQPRSHLTLHFHEPITLTHRGDIPRIVRQVQTQIASPTT